MKERGTMFQLPKNEPQVPKDTPRNFFIFGETMSGKSYLANEFPSPIIINTDGNAEANTVPAIQLSNVKDRNGKITKSVIDQLSEIVLALQTQQHSYKTVIVDVIDDVIEMIRIAICNEYNVRSLGDIPWGKGRELFNQTLGELVLDLKALPVNVIYISRQITKTDPNTDQVSEIPSLKETYVNLINGNSDLMIQTQKVGNNYIRKVDRKRKAYKAEQVDDKKILSILQSIKGALDTSGASKSKAEKF